MTNALTMDQAGTNQPMAYQSTLMDIYAASMLTFLATSLVIPSLPSASSELVAPPFAMVLVLAIATLIFRFATLLFWRTSPWSKPLANDLSVAREALGSLSAISVMTGFGAATVIGGLFIVY